MGIINSLKRIYNGKYEVTDTLRFSTEELAAIEKVQIVESKEFGGNSCCLFLKGGRKGYIAMSQFDSTPVGTVVDPKQVQVLVLSREGDDDIMRAEIVK